VLAAILDAGYVAHVAVSDQDGQPYVVPVGYARQGDRVLFHGSSGSRLFRGLAQGVPTCLTVTLLDGMVLARSAFESSMNYRSVMVLGTAVVLEGEEKLAALERVSEHLLPGQWDVIRQPTKKELAATLMLALPLDECSVKVSAGGPTDEQEDIDDPVYGRIWAGHVPLTEAFGDPVVDPHTPAGTPVPDHVRAWTRS
jgi:nitroimidazol reductase NimA-like FMN-containing flavoprotein (pyridoxamine 5'-phosphate oxidase superfamily)